MQNVLLVRDTPLRVVDECLGDCGTGTMVHVEPFQCSARPWTWYGATPEVDDPTAMQDAASRQLTELSVDGSPAEGSGEATTAHALPFHVSVRVCVIGPAGPACFPGLLYLISAEAPAS